MIGVTNVTIKPPLFFKSKQVWCFSRLLEYLMYAITL